VINARVVSRGRYGRTKEMWFGTSTKKIMETLMKDTRLDDERLKNIDTSRFTILFR
jgi:cell division control protein 6